MFETATEIANLAILVVVTWRLTLQRPKVQPKHRGFDLLLVGFFLLCAAATMDVFNLQNLSITSHSFFAQVFMFAELVLGYMLGILLVCGGLMTWVPALIAHQDQVGARLATEDELRRTASELEVRNQSLALINDLTGRLHGTYDIEAIAVEAVNALVQSTDPPAVAFYLVSDDLRFLQLIASHGFGDMVRNSDNRLTLDGSMSGLAMARQELVQSESIADDTRLEPAVRDQLVEHGFESATCVPLIYRGKALGSVNLLFHERTVLDEQQIFNLQAISQTVSLAIVNARNYAAIAHRASHDSLTGLPNREQLHRRLQSILSSASRGGQKTGLMLFDLDHFKEINDSLGHHLGDQLLIAIGERVSREMRHRGATLCRLGGDEFAVMIPKAGSIQNVKETAQGVLDAFRSPFSVQETAIQVGASLGISISPDHAEDSHELLRCADVAMYRAKVNVSGIEVYQKELDRHTPERLTLMAELGEAITKGHMQLYFQPKVSLKNRRIVGFEALIRWNHFRRGMLMPDAFVPLAELSTVIHPMTTWVVNEAATQLRRWNDRGLQLSMAVNLSARNLLDHGFAEEVVGIMTSQGIDPSHMEFELTETALMNDPELAEPNLTAITRAGSSLAIDDFGTGYSSLALLRRFPIRALKIDRSFVSDLLTDEQSESIVRSTITLGKSLGLQLVAEGVENEQTSSVLCDMGCDLAQGYTFSRPMPAEEVDRWLQTGGSRCPVQQPEVCREGRMPRRGADHMDR